MATMNDETVELLDAAFWNVHSARGTAAAMATMAYRNGVMDAIAAMTGAESEALYEEFSERLTANVERAIAAQT